MHEFYRFYERTLKNFLRPNTANANLFLNSFAEEDSTNCMKVNLKASGLINTKLRGKGHEGDAVANQGHRGGRTQWRRTTKCPS